jgi:uncharacterized protein YbjT (DUF2867 family)
MSTPETALSGGGSIFLTGGTGFVGSALQTALGNRPVRMMVRDGSEAAKTVDGSVELVEGDVTDRESLRGAIDGCQTVIHLVAIIEEEGDQTFDRVIRQGTENVVDEALQAGVSHFIDMSALGTSNRPQYPYFYAKWQGEEAVRDSGLSWTIFRPSIIFGPGDGFINQLASLVRKAPVLPIVGDGSSKFQPVHVTEVAEAFRRVVDDPSTQGMIHELGGPDILTYEGIVDVIRDRLDTKRPKVHMPVPLMHLAVSLASPLPKFLRPPVTRAQLQMLEVDNCTSDSATPRLIGRDQIRVHDGIDYIA